MRTRPRLGKRPESFDNQAAWASADEKTIVIPENWDVYNATRPLYGTVTWVNPSFGAWFYAAVNPADADANGWRRQNETLDAALVAWFEIDRVRMLTQKYYDALMPGRVDVSNHTDSVVWRSFCEHVLETL